MHPRESFTLCPAGACSSTIHDGAKETRVIPGTIRRDWRTDDDRRLEIVPEIGWGIRAAPFEPCVNDRNLPTSGIIKLQFHQGHTSTSLTATRDPPAEHKFLVKDDGNVDWKANYLQSEVSRSQTRMEVLYLLDERRRMRIEMLKLEARLHKACRQQNRVASISDFDVKETSEDIKAPVVGNSIDGDAGEREKAPTVIQESCPRTGIVERHLEGNETEIANNDATMATPSSKTEFYAVDMRVATQNVTTRKRARQKAAQLEMTEETEEESNVSAILTRGSKRIRNKGE